MKNECIKGKAKMLGSILKLLLTLHCIVKVGNYQNFHSAHNLLRRSLHINRLLRDYQGLIGIGLRGSNQLTHYMLTGYFNVFP